MTIVFEEFEDPLSFRSAAGVLLEAEDLLYDLLIQHRRSEQVQNGYWELDAEGLEFRVEEHVPARRARDYPRLTYGKLDNTILGLIKFFAQKPYYTTTFEVLAIFDHMGSVKFAAGHLTKQQQSIQTN